MTREIKFRAWDKENKQMFVPIGYSYIDGHLTCIIQDKKTMQNSVTEYLDETWYQESREPDYGVELMQYTGLKDKNGKEIYEGDIVKWTSTKLESKITDRNYRQEEVIFREGAWQVDSAMFNLAIYSDVEIIGNIYENRDLIK